MAETHTTATTEVPAHGAEHVEPSAFGFGPGGWVAIAMLLVFAIFIWKKVPAAIGKALDSKIALIRDQLAEAETLRKDAEALKAEYEAKSRTADQEAAAMVERAKHEAEAIVAKAEQDGKALGEQLLRRHRRRMRGIARLGEGHAERQHAIGGEAGIDTAEAQEAAHHQAGPHRQ